MFLEWPRDERERLSMVEIITLEIGAEVWMIKGKVKRVVEFLLGLSTLQAGTRRAIDGVKEFLESLGGVHWMGWSPVSVPAHVMTGSLSLGNIHCVFRLIALREQAITKAVLMTERGDYFSNQNQECSLPSHANIHIRYILH